MESRVSELKKVREKLESGQTLEFQEKRLLCNELMTREPRMEKLIVKWFDEEDYRTVLRHKVGDGVIGGKACGVLLARKLIKEKLPEYESLLLPHHSWFIGSDVFAEYLWEETFSERTKREFGDLLAHLGDDPYVVRSSSTLEDGFDHAFTGKYESVFCTNQGKKDERIEELKAAVFRVYKSVWNESAVEYRRTRGLTHTDERMALLVQRVEGMRMGSYYLPLAAGMGCSYNPYKWMEQMNPEAGMLRIVLGLGTRAVERTPGDYPRLIDLDRARGSLYASAGERHKYSQRQVDVLDLENAAHKTIWLEELIPLLPERGKKLVLSHDTDAEQRLQEMGRYRPVLFADCQGIAHDSDFMNMMQRILKMLESEYGRPVDIEFAMEEGGDGKIHLNLFQCRPLRQVTEQKFVMPEGNEEEVLFDVRRTSMWRSKEEKLDIIVWVDPQKYYEYPYAKKPDAAHMIGVINQYFSQQGRHMMLLVPGRCGTSSPELGVPVKYSDVSCFSAICEVAYSKAGYNPSLSYGSHMFQELVEADIYYGAINENSKTKIYRPDYLNTFHDVFGEIWPDKAEFGNMIRVFDVSENHARLLLDAKEGRAVCRIKKTVDRKTEK